MISLGMLFKKESVSTSHYDAGSYKIRDYRCPCLRGLIIVKVLKLLQRFYLTVNVNLTSKTNLLHKVQNDK